MRIFKYVFGGLFIVMLLGIVGWYAREKIVLTVASHQLKNDVASLRRLAYGNTVRGGCQTALTGYQLRFISETEYVLEPLCSGLEGSVIQEGRLPLGVTRLYGSGVLIEIIEGVPSIKDAWIHLNYGESQVVVGLFDGMAKVVWDIDNLEIGGESPANARCADWGFSCCESDVEVGEFTKVRTYDCVNSCYQYCNRLPLLLFFNTSPVLNQVSRVVAISKSDPVVRFGYEVSDDQEGVEVEIDFGDGKESVSLPAKNAQLIHEYMCQQEQCAFMAVIKAKDASGNSLVNTELNKIRVVVR